jgi:hypothetical protein
MEFVNILRVVWHHRLLVALGAAGAMLVWLMLAFTVSFMPPKIESRAVAPSTVASARVLINASGDRASDLDSELAQTIALRARLLADLLMTDEMHATMARDAGMPPQQFAVLGPSTGEPPTPVTTAVRSADAARVPREKYEMELRVDGDDPIVSIRVTGLDPAGEVRLVDAAAKGLEEIIAGGRRVYDRPLSAERLGPAVVRTLSSESRMPLALAAGAALFALWCAAIILVPALFALRGFSLTPPAPPRVGGS